MSTRPPLGLSPFVLAGGRRRRHGRARILRDLSAVLVISGLLLIADAAVTLAWQEPLTALIATFERTEINNRLLEAGLSLSETARRALAMISDAPLRIAYVAREERRRLVDGQAAGRLRIPRIGASYTVVEGTDPADLEKGPGHYPTTALPGMGQTVAIAGHRTTYLAPFRRIDALRAGDRILLTMPYGRFVYVVQYHRIVSPSAWWVTRDLGYDRLVLSACNPLYSAAQRIVVFARLASERPLGAARVPPILVH